MRRTKSLAGVSAFLKDTTSPAFVATFCGPLLKQVIEEVDEMGKLLFWDPRSSARNVEYEPKKGPSFPCGRLHLQEARFPLVVEGDVPKAEVSTECCDLLNDLLFVKCCLGSRRVRGYGRSSKKQPGVKEVAERVQQEE